MDPGLPLSQAAAAATGGGGVRDTIAMLLATARIQISQGNPASALQAVIAALKVSGGEETVLQTLARARDVYRNRVKANAAADELATLFAECAILEANNVSANESSSSPPAVEMMDQGSHVVNFGMMNGFSENETPILAESGRMQVVLDASSDGSSFICLQCGGLVSNLRRDEHMTYWCTNSS